VKPFTIGAAPIPHPVAFMQPDAPPPPLLRQRPFRMLWAGQSISVLGDQVTAIALPLVAVITLNASAFQVGLLTALTWLPHLLLSLQAGEWLDRRSDRRRVMVAADFGRSLAILSIPLAYWAGLLTIYHLFAVAFAVGSLAVFFDLSWSTVFASIVPRRDFVEANARLSQSRGVAGGAGPAIGGLLVDVIRAPGALVVDALSFLASAWFVSRIEAVEPAPAPRDTAGLFTRLSVGLRFLFRHPLMRASLLALVTVNAFNLMFSALFVLYATRELGVGPSVLGLIMASGAVGAIAGAIVAPRISRALGVGPALMLGIVLFPAPMILVPAAAGPDWLIVAMLFAAILFAMFGVMILDINGNAMLVAATPDRIRARVVGAHRTINYGVRPFGALVAGALASVIGIHATLWIATLGGLFAVFWLVFSPIPRIRDLPSPLE
jgi:MFS family permease